MIVARKTVSHILHSVHYKSIIIIRANNAHNSVTKLTIIKNTSYYIVIQLCATLTIGQ